MWPHLMPSYSFYLHQEQPRILPISITLNIFLFLFKRIYLQHLGQNNYNNIETKKLQGL